MSIGAKARRPSVLALVMTGALLAAPASGAAAGLSVGRLLTPLPAVGPVAQAVLPVARPVVQGVLSLPSAVSVPGLPVKVDVPPLPSVPPAPSVPSVTLPAAPSGSGLPAAGPAAVSKVVSTVTNQAPATPAARSTAGRPSPAPAASGSGSNTAARAGRAAPFAQAHPATGAPTRARTASAPATVGRAAAPQVAGTARSAHLATPSPAPLSLALPAAGRSHGTAQGPLHAITSALIDPLKLLPVPDWSRPIILLLIVVALGAAIRARWNALVARRLRRRGEDMWRDLQSLQSALVPELEEEIGALSVSAAYCPADGPGAGGDFYDVFNRRDGSVAIVLGDVSGHGREALTRAAHMRFTLRAYLEAGLSPRDALTLAGDTIFDRGGERFTTVAVGIYDAAAATLTYATAGHAPPILVGAPEYELVTTCSSPPIGLGIPTGRRQTTVSLPAGAMACFFSDGLTEARTDPGMLGRERLASMVEDLGSQPGAEALLERVRSAALDSRDDMATCIVGAHSGDGPDVCCEVIELDAAQLASPKIDQFLQSCGASHDASFQAVAEAHAVAAVRGSVVLHIDRAAEPVKITVAWPHTPALTVSADRAALAAGPGLMTAGVPAQAAQDTLDSRPSAAAPPPQLALAPPV